MSENIILLLNHAIVFKTLDEIPKLYKNLNFNWNLYEHGLYKTIKIRIHTKYTLQCREENNLTQNHSKVSTVFSFILHAKSHNSHNYETSLIWLFLCLFYEKFVINQLIWRLFHQHQASKYNIQGCERLITFIPLLLKQWITVLIGVNSFKYLHNICSNCYTYCH